MIGVELQRLGESLAGSGVVLLQVQIHATLDVPRRRLVGAALQEIAGCSLSRSHIVVLIVDTDQVFQQRGVVFQVVDRVLQCVDISHGVFFAVEVGLQTHEVKVAHRHFGLGKYRLVIFESRIHVRQHVVVLLHIVSQHGTIVKGLRIFLGHRDLHGVALALQGRIVGQIDKFAEILVGARLVAVAVEENTGIEIVVTRIVNDLRGLVAIFLLGHFALGVGRMFENVALGVIIHHVVESRNELCRVERLRIGSIHEQGLEQDARALTGLVVNFAELRGLRVVEGGFEEFKRFGCLVLRKQIVCLVDYAVLCHTCQGESTENGQRKHFLHGWGCLLWVISCQFRAFRRPWSPLPPLRYRFRGHHFLRAVQCRLQFPPLLLRRWAPDIHC